MNDKKSSKLDSPTIEDFTDVKADLPSSPLPGTRKALGSSVRRATITNSEVLIAKLLDEVTQLREQLKSKDRELRQFKNPINIKKKTAFQPKVRLPIIDQPKWEYKDQQIKPPYKVQARAIPVPKKLDMSTYPPGTLPVVVVNSLGSLGPTPIQAPEEGLLVKGAGANGCVPVGYYDEGLGEFVALPAKGGAIRTIPCCDGFSPQSLFWDPFQTSPMFQPPSFSVAAYCSGPGPNEEVMVANQEPLTMSSETSSSAPLYVRGVNADGSIPVCGDANIAFRQVTDLDGTAILEAGCVAFERGVDAQNSRHYKVCTSDVGTSSSMPYVRLNTAAPI